MSKQFWRKPTLILGILGALGLLTAVACGGGTVEPTATATTGPAPTATATSATGVTAEPTATPTSEPGPVVTETPKRGGIIRQNRSDVVAAWDTHVRAGSEANQMGAKFQNTLFWNPYTDARGRYDLVPELAESYSVSGDGKTWTFKLHPGIRYQSYTPSHPRDGTTMTSADVKWSLEKIMGFHGQLISPRSGWMKEFVDIDRPDNGIEIVDELTFKLHMIQPFGSLPNILALGYSAIIPEGIKTTDMVTRPFGSGPFRVAEHQSGALVRFARNNDYYKPGLPYLDGWEFIYMTGDAIVEAAFATRRVDTGTGNPLPDNRALWEKLIAEGKIQIQTYSSDCRPQGVFMNMHKPPFNDKRLREIVNLGMDRQGYAAVVHDGLEVPPQLWLDPVWGKSEAEVLQMPGWRRPHDADLAEAQRLLKELYPGGIEIQHMSRNTSGYMRQAEYVAGNLVNIGFKVTIQPQDTAVTFERATNLDYTLWNYWFCQTSNTLEEFFAYFITGGSRNWFGLSDPKIDGAYLELAAISDPALKKQKAQELENILLDSVFAAPMGVPEGASARWSYVRDYGRGITGYTSFGGDLVWRSDV
ncbi:MAG: ABC transporter substrate-binding protein [Chloroflexi bacterium]|nr:ABC transporter substrate-binding protein [Chloroflexota bacterium]